MGDVTPDEESKVELSQLKLRLVYGRPGKKEPGWMIIRDIIKLGPSAEPLVSTVMEQYNEGNLSLPDSSLVDLYFAFPRPDILEAIRQDGRLMNLPVIEQCELLKWNVPDVEGALIEYLVHHWEKRDPWRCSIVKAFAIGGGRDAVEALEVIRFDLAGRVPENLARLPEIDAGEPESTDQILEGIEVRRDREFLATVREAVAEMHRRLGSVARLQLCTKVQMTTKCCGLLCFVHARILASDEANATWQDCLRDIVL